MTTFVSSGSLLPSEPDSVVGHGVVSQASENETVLRSTLTGFVNRINKLITVRALHSRYQAEIGDVVIGRIIELGDKRWKVNINANSYGILLLSSINLPDNELRKRTAEDQLNVRSFYTEGDLISCEVQQVKHSTSTIMLHTRSLRYGKLRNGQFVNVHNSLIKRCKQHFQRLQIEDQHTHVAEDIGIEIILGMNGMIFIHSSEVTNDSIVNELISSKVHKSTLNKAFETRQKVARVHNAILCLSRVSCSIYDKTIMAVYRDSLNLGVSIPDMLNRDITVVITQNAIDMR